MNDLAQVLLGGFALFCVLPMVIMLFVGYFAFRYFQRLLSEMTAPNAEKMIANYNALIAQNPNVSREQLVQRVINREAFKCGMVGLLTGVWGIFALPITLPLDFLLSVRIQAEMVAFIARLYGFSDSRDNQIATYIVMTGSEKVSQTTISLVMRFLVRLAGKAFAKFLPLISALVSFGVNYALAQSAGRLAWHWYARRATGAQAVA